MSLHSWAAQEVTTRDLGDREADLSPLFAASRPATTDLLVRAAYNRRRDAEAHTLPQALAQSAVAGERSREGRPSREARVAGCFTTVTRVPPVYHQGRYAPVTLSGVEARERAPPPGENALQWIIVTTLPVTTFEEACECLQGYSYRWMIEQYHRTLKSGCRMETLPLQTAARLPVAVAVYCLVAGRLLWLTDEARRTPQTSCATVLQPHEWQA